MDDPLNGQNDIHFGAKTIGFIGSLSMLLNNILGPGIANFSGLYQQAGWVVPSAFILICAGSSLAGGEMLVIAMRSMPGNERFQKRVEYSTLCKHYFAPSGAIFCLIVFQLAMLSANIGNIIQTSQVFDQTIDTVFGDSCALELYPRFFQFFCDTSNSDITPFGTGKILLSFGACIVALCSLPLGYWNLDDNIVVQNVAMVLILVSMVAWIIIFVVLGLDPSRIPTVRTELGISAFHGTGGTILFNFMFISTLPSWICEKHPSVTAKNVISVTLVLAVIMFIFIGVGGGWAFPEFYDGNNTLLSELHHIRNRSLSVVATIFVDVYAIASNLSSIPIFSIMMRYNLIEQKIMGPRMAGFVSVVVPWLTSVLLYCGSGFQTIVEFAGTFTSSLVNLIVPSLLFIASQRAISLRRISQRSIGGGGEEGSGLALPEVERYSGSSPDIRRDKSGLINTPEARRRWVQLAWMNVILMGILTIISIADQIVNGGS